MSKVFLNRPLTMFAMSPPPLPLPHSMKLWRFFIFLNLVKIYLNLALTGQNLKTKIAKRTPKHLKSRKFCCPA